MPRFDKAQRMYYSNIFATKLLCTSCDPDYIFDEIERTCIKSICGSYCSYNLNNGINMDCVLIEQKP
jgi:hypothetical protein